MFVYSALEPSDVSLPSSRWYFAVISMSGVFAVTFSVIFAYVADITQEHERTTAYGLVRSRFCQSAFPQYPPNLGLTVLLRYDVNLSGFFIFMLFGFLLSFIFAH